MLQQVVEIQQLPAGFKCFITRVDLRDMKRCATLLLHSAQFPFGCENTAYNRYVVYQSAPDILSTIWYLKSRVRNMHSSRRYIRENQIYKLWHNNNNNNNNNHGSTALYGLGPPLSEVTRSLCICGSEGPAHWPRFSTRSWCDCQSHLAVSQETWVRNGRLNIAYGHYWFFFMPEGSFTCRKSTTWDRRLYFPSEGSCAPDFYHP
jgi:hypothetical protein